MTSENDQLLKTQLHAKHVAMEAKMSDEAGWLVPLSYRGVLEECHETTSRAGVFDLSHMGRIRLRGDGALGLLERLCTADVVRQEDDTAVFTLLCNEGGGIIDHGHLLRLDDSWLLVTSAVNRRKVLDHIEAHNSDGVKVSDQTQRTAMIAVTGPAGAEILDPLLPEKVSTMPPGALKVGSMMIARYIAMRTSWTGLWGLAVILPNMIATLAWDFITAKAGANAVKPAGMAALDVLRIEAGLVRYGHETNETIDPITAGLESAVDWEHEFIGAEAVRIARQKGSARRRVAVVFEPAGDATRPIPRQGAAVRLAGAGEVGTVTSGTFSPTLDRPIAMAYVSADAADVGTQLLVDIGGEPHPASVVQPPLLT